MRAATTAAGRHMPANWLLLTYPHHCRIEAGSYPQGTPGSTLGSSYAYNGQVRRTATLPQFSLEITRLPPGPTCIARPIPLHASEIGSSLAHQLRLFTEQPY